VQVVEEAARLWINGIEALKRKVGVRAVYDLSGQGLPFQVFSLEQVDRHWFIAE